ncbi:MAG: acyl-CoA dehydrogenase, partial [Gammaproteobacteria bacterium]
CTNSDVVFAISVQMCMATSILARFGSDELRDAFLKPAIRGESVAALAINESGFSIDITGIQTIAQKEKNHYRINGEKAWVANATQADFFCVMANTSTDKPLFNKSFLIVPRHSAGVSVGTPIEQISTHALDTAPVYFNDVCVPIDYRIGAENQGFPMQMMQFQEEHLSSAASTLLGMERCLALTIEHGRKRNAFGQALIDNQYVHFQIAEMKTEVELLRSLVYRACDDYMVGKDVMQLAAMAKLKSVRLMRKISDKCLPFWAASGLKQPSPIHQHYRDWRLLAIDGCTDEMMLDIICKTMNILPLQDETI